MKEYIIRLKPRSAFDQAIHSDTIFGAICWALRTLFGVERLRETLTRFRDGDPPFLISSAFPCRDTRRGIMRYYLPKPALPPMSTARISELAPEEKRNIYHSEKFSLVRAVQRYKEFKAVQWIPSDIFLRILKDPREETLFQAFLENHFSAPHFQTLTVRQKNSIDRLATSTAGAGNVFHAQEAHFRNGHGLYLLLRTSDEGNNIMRPVLKYLADSGLGADARTGKNWFDLEINEQALFGAAAGGEGFFTLSRYIPQEPIASQKSWYSVVAVRSTVESRIEFAGGDIWKRRVMYITAGSYITPETSKNHYGGIVPVKELAGQTIYQYGLAFPVWVGRGDARCNTN